MLEEEDPPVVCQGLFEQAALCVLQHVETTPGRPLGINFSFEARLPLLPATHPPMSRHSSD